MLSPQGPAGGQVSAVRDKDGIERQEVRPWAINRPCMCGFGQPSSTERPYHQSVHNAV